jgi:restriction system protein
MRKTVAASVAMSWGQSKAIGVSTTIQWREPPQAILLQAIVDRVHPVEEGFVIKTMEPAWLEISDALAKNPNALSELTPQQWEELIAASYDKAGFDEVVLTPRSGDFGRDVIAVRKGWGSIRIIDQVKALSPGRVVTANEVRALLGVLGAGRNATKGVVTTTSTFAPRISVDPFIAPYLPYRLELVDGQALNERLLLLGKGA